MSQVKEISLEAYAEALPIPQPARRWPPALTFALVIAATLLLVAVLILDNSVGQELGRKAVESGVIR